MWKLAVIIGRNKMKHCNNCNVDVNTTNTYCPLCYNSLETISDKKEPALYDVCDKKPKENVKTHFVTKLFTLISLAVILACVFINIVTRSKPWSLIVVSSILYLWVLIRHTIMSLRNVFEKTFLQVACIALILITTSFMSVDKGWFLNYVLPSLLIAASLTMLMMLFASCKRKSYEFSFFVIYLIFIIVGVIFWCTNFAKFKLLYSVLVMLDALIVVGMLLMDFKTIKSEFLRKFHL